MLKSLLVVIFLLIGTSFFSGCGQAPDIPSLNRFPRTEGSPIALSDYLSPSDIKNIFRAVNRDGKLKSLERYFLAPTDEELNEFSDLVTKYVYQDAQLNTGLVSLLRNRFRKRDFSDLLQRSQNWVKDEKYSAKANTVLDAIRMENFPEIISSDIGGVLPTFTVPLDRVWKQANRYQEKYEWPKEPSPTSQELFVTLKKLVEDKDVVDRLSAQAGDWKESGFLVNLLKGFQHDYQIHKIEAFEGLAHKLPQMLATENNPVNQLEKLMNLIQILDNPTDGLFAMIQSGLDEKPDKLTLLVDYLRFLDADAVNRYFIKALSETATSDSVWKKSFWENIPKRAADGSPTEEFKILFKRAVEAFERIAGPEKTDTSLDFFIANLPIYLNAYVFTRWIEQTLLDAVATPAWKNAKEEVFLPVLLSLPVSPKAFQLNFKKDGFKQELKLLLASTAPDFMRAFEKYVTPSALGIGAFNYELPAYEQGQFSRNSEKAVEKIDEIRPIANSASWLRTLLSLATSKSEFAFQLADLESSNLMSSLNNIILGFPFELWMKLEHILFVKLKIGQLTNEIRGPLLDLYESKPALKAKAAGILDNVQSFHELHIPMKDLPAPITLYHSILKEIPSSQIDLLTKILRLVADTKVVSLDPATKQPLYPGIYRILQRGSGLGEFMLGIALVGQNPMLEITGRVVHAMIGDSKGVGIRRHAQIAQRLCETRPDGVTAWISEFMNHSPDWVESLATVPALEEQWARRVVDSQDHKILWRFLMRYGSIDQTLQLSRELLVLDRKGTLKEAFELLGQLRNERLKVVSDFLLEWQKSGELTQFLQTVELLLSKL